MRLFAKRLLKQFALPVYLRMRGMYYHGNEVHCPCCNSSFSRFLPTGVNRRPAQCPRCRSNERDRALWLYLDRHPDFIRPGKKLLHIGPETLFYNRFKKVKGLHYTPADKFVKMFERCYPKDTLFLDIVDMPEIPDNTYDVILCSHVLEYIREDDQAMRELFRVLKPDGIAQIQVPIKPGLKVTHEDDTITTAAERAAVFGDPGHIRFYGADYESKLLAQGFETAFTPFPQLFAPAEIKRYGLVATDDFQLAKKSVAAVQLIQQIISCQLLWVPVLL
ncbi:class I SAM-dependent methyltransferase [Chitinophaga nivalis]|uniref:Class I SAM-dependent methyltransferase n=1 Tax=Chitinophaga nivalis TaxID=2991709 RepID=A0ABT3IIV3_9BACT|nr:class I SAM-dependent methyltransferase [Chitinophaga nivalis]MCW3466436.1 class I SAM-dependent methyltransferase [Chitinophaga nivalis]MCW3483873.1 class I SAM-dependent methyltransferase [Chitinophaga nivalis]